MILSILGAFLTAFATVFFSIKKLIHIAYAKHLFDEPTEKRKIHVRRTPNLGGISIFAALLFSSSLFVETHNILFVRYSIVASLILFFVGVVDDLVGLNPLKKFIAQVAVAILVVVPGGTHFSGFYGIFGLHALPDYINILTSISFVLLLVNAFNLIDGINCLAAGIGLVICIAYSYFFWMLQAHWLLIIAVSMSGALIGFMIFNRTPAKIFMGDSGSLILGLVIPYLQ
jgi:UDP-N-acetylmuramyl pentapeptide phosphotransferase/UDP-N-acetylglucosamine-1-phosphate transferase